MPWLGPNKLLTIDNVVGALMYLNEATLLNNIRTRYFKDRIYVSVIIIIIIIGSIHEKHDNDMLTFVLELRSQYSDSCESILSRQGPLLSENDKILSRKIPR